MIVTSHIVKIIISKDELIEEIKEIKKENSMLNNNELNLLCFTRLNTKINRDHLDYSAFYTNKGYKTIYGQKLTDSELHQSNRRHRQYIPKDKKISFEDTITYCHYE